MFIIGLLAVLLLVGSIILYRFEFATIAAVILLAIVVLAGAPKALIFFETVFTVGVLLSSYLLKRSPKYDEKRRQLDLALETAISGLKLFRSGIQKIFQIWKRPKVAKASKVTKADPEKFEKAEAVPNS